MFILFRLRRRLKKFLKGLSQNWRDTVSLKMLLEISLLLSPYPLKHYRIDLGKRILFSTGFLNAENVVRRLRRVSEAVRLLEGIDDSIAGAYKNPVEHSLDSFLVTMHNETVHLPTFVNELCAQLINLKSLLGYVELVDTMKSQYYHRALSGLYRDTNTLLEALLTAALVDNEQRPQSPFGGS